MAIKEDNEETVDIENGFDSNDRDSVAEKKAKIRKATESVDDASKALWKKGLKDDDIFIFKAIAFFSKDASEKFMNLSCWTADLSKKDAEYKASNVTSTIDFIASEDVSFRLKIFGVILQMLQTFVYGFAISSFGPDFGPPEWTQGFVFALVYAAFAVSSTFFDLLKSCLLNASYFDVNKKTPLFAKVMLVMELVNMFMFLIAASVSIPRQGSTLDIVLNCTALTSICILDEVVFKSMIVKVKIDERRDYLGPYLDDHFSGFINFLYVFSVVVLLLYFISGSSIQRQ